MEIIVNDTNIFIDLHSCGLLDSFFKLPYKVHTTDLARRCFVGNLYKQVKDPNLVGALSGHKEDNRALARYREIASLPRLKRNTPYRTKR